MVDTHKLHGDCEWIISVITHLNERPGLHAN